MSKGSKTQTVTQETSIPDYIQNPQQAVLQAGGELIAPFMQVPDKAVASLNTDHDAAFDFTRNAAMSQFMPNAAYADRLAGVEYNPDIAGYANAATVSGDQIANKMNPYTDLVVNQAMQGLRDDYGQAQTDLASRYAAGGAFGGSREAVSRANLADDYMKNAGNMRASLLSGAYDRASGLAESEAARQMQAVSGANSARLGQVNTQLAALGAGNQAAGDLFNRQLMAGTSMAGVGDVIRGVEQQNLDVPMNKLREYNSLVPGVYPQSSTSTQPLYSNPTSSILGAGMLFSGMFG